MKQTVGIVSWSSGIGQGLSKFFLEDGFHVVGSVRKPFADQNTTANLDVVSLQLEAKNQSESDLLQFLERLADWDILIFCNGTTLPVAKLLEAEMTEVENSFEVNFLATLRLLRKASLAENPNNKARTVIVFSGGGTNSANDFFGAYTLSKILLIKLVELLASEHTGMQFVCLGPGWVDTKIHHEMMESSSTPETLKRLYSARKSTSDFTAMKDIYETIRFVHKQFPLFSGRNISVNRDNYTSHAYIERMATDASFLKLRRSGNEFANNADQGF